MMLTSHYDLVQKNSQLNWKEREEELIELLNKHRKSDGDYDVLVPSSGGKDSMYVAHILKYKYNMNPLTVTWAPNAYTDIGLYNFQAQIVFSFDFFLYLIQTIHYFI